MVRSSDIPADLADMACPSFEGAPWVSGPPLAESRVAMVSTAGLQHRGDRPFSLGSADYRVIRGSAAGDDLTMSHVSTNYDRTGFQQDINVVLPVDRLGELAADGTIGSVAEYHYSFMGATSPGDMEPMIRQVAGMFKADRVDSVLLCPV